MNLYMCVSSPWVHLGIKHNVSQAYDLLYLIQTGYGSDGAF